MEPNRKTNPERTAPPPNPGRRRFLRSMLLSGALLSCSRRERQSTEETSKTIHQNRELRLGSCRIILEECKDDGKIRSAKFRIFREGRALTDSVSMAVPGYLSINGFIPGYEVYVESVSCGRAPSARLTITEKQSAGTSGAAATDLPVFGSAIALAASLVLWAVQRRQEAAEKEPIILSPKRPEPSEPF